MSIELNGLPANYNTNPLGNNTARLVKKEAMPPIGDTSDPEPTLTEAIRLYRNFVLTGVRELTSEEKKEIENRIEDYLKAHDFLEKYASNKASKEDYAALNDFIKGLYAQFGSKGDFYEFVTDFIEGMLEKVVNPNKPPHPPFKVEIPPEHAMANISKKPRLMPFQCPSPHQFLMTDDSSYKA